MYGMLYKVPNDILLAIIYQAPCRHLSNEFLLGTNKMNTYIAILLQVVEQKVIAYSMSLSNWV